MNAVNGLKNSIYAASVWAAESLIEHKVAAAASSALAAAGWYLGLNPLVSLPIFALGAYATNKLIEPPPTVAIPEPEVQAEQQVQDEQPIVVEEVSELVVEEVSEPVVEPSPVIETPLCKNISYSLFDQSARTHYSSSHQGQSSLSSCFARF